MPFKTSTPSYISTHAKKPHHLQSLPRHSGFFFFSPCFKIVFMHPLVYMGQTTTRIISCIRGTKTGILLQWYVCDITGGFSFVCSPYSRCVSSNSSLTTTQKKKKVWQHLQCVHRPEWPIGAAAAAAASAVAQIWHYHSSMQHNCDSHWKEVEGWGGRYQ